MESLISLINIAKKNLSYYPDREIRWTVYEIKLI